jgi:hypothetical protein
VTIPFIPDNNNGLPSINPLQGTVAGAAFSALNSRTQTNVTEALKAQLQGDPTWDVLWDQFFEFIKAPFEWVFGVLERMFPGLDWDELESLDLGEASQWVWDQLEEVLLFTDFEQAMLDLKNNPEQFFTSLGTVAVDGTKSFSDFLNELWIALTGQPRVGNKSITNVTDATAILRDQSGTAYQNAESAEKLAKDVISSGSNIIKNNGFENIFFQQLGSMFSGELKRSGNFALKVTGNGATTVSYSLLSDSDLTPTSVAVTAGDIYYAEVWVRGGSTNAQTTGGTDGVRMLFQPYSETNAALAESFIALTASTALKAGWNKLSGYVTMPPGAKWLVMKLQLRPNVSFNEHYFFDDVTVREVTLASTANAAAGTAQTGANAANTNLQTTVDSVHQAVQGGTSTGNTPSTVKTNLQKAWADFWDGLNGSTGSTTKLPSEVRTAAGTVRSTANTASTNANTANTGVQSTADNIFQGILGGSSTGNAITTIKTNLQTAWANLWDGLNGSTGSTTKLPGDVQTAATSVRSTANTASTNANTANTSVQSTVDNIHQAVQGGSATGNGLATIKTNLASVWNNLWDGLNGSPSQTSTGKVFSDLFTVGSTARGRAETGITNAATAQTSVQTTVDGIHQAVVGGTGTGNALASVKSNLSSVWNNLWDGLNGSATANSTGKVFGDLFTVGSTARGRAETGITNAATAQTSVQTTVDGIHQAVVGGTGTGNALTSVKNNLQSVWNNLWDGLNGSPSQTSTGKVFGDLFTVGSTARGRAETGITNAATAQTSVQSTVDNIAQAVVGGSGTGNALATVKSNLASVWNNLWDGLNGSSTQTATGKVVGDLFLVGSTARGRAETGITNAATAQTTATTAQNNLNAVASSVNLCISPNFEDSSILRPKYSNEAGVTLTYTAAEKFQGTQSLSWTHVSNVWSGPILSPISSATATATTRYTVREGDTINVRVKIKPLSTNNMTVGFVGLWLRWVNSATGATTDAPVSSINNTALSTTVWSDLARVASCPSGYDSLSVFVLSSNTTTAGNVYFIDAVSVREETTAQAAQTNLQTTVDGIHQAVVGGSATNNAFTTVKSNLSSVWNNLWDGLNGSASQNSTGKVVGDLFTVGSTARGRAETGITNAATAQSSVQTTVDGIHQAVVGGATTGNTLASVKTNLASVWNNLWDGLNGSATATSTGKVLGDLFTVGSTARGRAETGITNAATAQTSVQSTVDNIHQAVVGGSTTGNTLASVKNNLASVWNNLWDGLNGSATANSTGKVLGDLFTVGSTARGRAETGITNAATAQSSVQTTVDGIHQAVVGGSTTGNALSSVKNNFQSVWNNLWDGLNGSATASSTGKVFSDLFTVGSTARSRAETGITNAGTAQTTANTARNVIDLKAGDFSNLVPGSDFESTTQLWQVSTAPNTFSIATDQFRSGTKSLKIVGGDTAQRSITYDSASPNFEVKEGDQIYMELWVRKSADYANTDVNDPRFRCVRGTGSASPGTTIGDILLLPANIPTADSWTTKLSRTVTIPAGVRTVQFVFTGPKLTPAMTGTLWVDDIVVRRVTKAEEVVRLPATKVAGLTTIGSNICPNNSFEDSTFWAGATMFSTEQERTGTQSLKMVATGANQDYWLINDGVSQISRITASPGDSFYVEFWVYGASHNTGTGTISMFITPYTNANVILTSAGFNYTLSTANKNVWTKVSGTVTIPTSLTTAASISARIRLASDVPVNTSPTLPDTYYFDDFIIREVTVATTAQTAASTAQSNVQTTIDNIHQAVVGGSTTNNTLASVKSNLQSVWNSMWDGLNGSASQISTGKVVGDLFTVGSTARSRAELGITNAGTAQTTANTSQSVTRTYLTSGSNLVANPSFENTLFANSSNYTTEITARTGTRSLKLPGNGTTEFSVNLFADDADVREVKGEGGDTYYVEFWLRGDSLISTGDAGIYFGCRNASGTVFDFTNVFVTLTTAHRTAWIKHSGYMTLPAGTARFSAVASARPNVPAGRIVYMDDVVIREVTEGSVAKANAQTTVDNIVQAVAGGTSTGNTLASVKSNLQSVWNNLWDGLNGSATASSTGKVFSDLFTVGSTARSRAELGISNADTAQSSANTARNVASTLVTAGGNLVANSSFENTSFLLSQVQGSYSTGEVTAQTGTRTLKIISNASSAYAYVTSDLTALRRVPASAGDVFYVEFWVRGAMANAQTTGGTNGIRLVINFRNAADASVGSAVVNQLASTALDGVWTKVSGYTTASPAPATAVGFYAYLELTAAVTTGETYYFDDVVIQRVTEGVAADTKAQSTVDNIAQAVVGGSATGNSIASVKTNLAAVWNNIWDGLNGSASQTSTGKVVGDLFTVGSTARSRAELGISNAGTAQSSVQSTVDNIAQAVAGGTGTGNSIASVKSNLQTVWNNLWDGLNGSSTQTATGKVFSDLFTVGSTARSRAELGITNAGTADTKAQNTLNNVAGAFAGLETIPAGTLPAEAYSAMQQAYETLANNTQAIQELQAGKTNGTVKGNSFNINFKNLPDSGTMPAGWTVTYSGANTTSTIGILNGLAQWRSPINSSRDARIIYNSSTATDFQLIKGTMSSPPQPASSGGTVPRFWAVGRVNSETNPTSYVWARAYCDGFLSFKGEMGYTMNGVETVWASNIPLTWSLDMTFKVGNGTNDRQYQVFSGNTLVKEWDERFVNGVSGTINESRSVLDGDWLVSRGAATAGTFTLTFEGATTAAIAFNATAATVKSALGALGKGTFFVNATANGWFIDPPNTLSTLTGAGTLTGGTLSITKQTARRWGSIAQIRSGSSTYATSGAVGACSVTDNPSPNVNGSVARMTRTSTGTATYTGGSSETALGGSFFDTIVHESLDVDATTSDGTFTVTESKPYIVTGRVMTGNVSAWGSLILQVFRNSTWQSLQYGQSIFTQDSEAALYGSWIQYLYAGEKVRLAYVRAGITTTTLTGESSGKKTYFSITGAG